MLKNFDTDIKFIRGHFARSFEGFNSGLFYFDDCGCSIDKGDSPACFLISRNALHKVSDVECFIKDCHKALKTDGHLIISDIITDIEDAFLNTAEFARDNTHVRFYTVQEIIDHVNGLFRLEYYRLMRHTVRLEEYSFSVDLLKKFPENIQKELKFMRNDSGEILNFTLKVGIFIFRAFPQR